MKLELKKSKEQRAALISDRRKQDYPLLADLADAIYWREKGDPKPLAAYVARVDAVKAKYPKP